MLEKKREISAEKKVKSVPTAVVSSKFIQKEKATSKMTDRFGNEITMEEMMKKSREGMVGKGGKAVKWTITLFKSLNKFNLITFQRQQA